jgi:transcriptional regulator with XRE-family HTH domain
MTVAELAQLTGLSIGMLSKIENGLTSPSLTTLQALSNAIGVPITAFFARFEEHRPVVHVRAGEGAYRPNLIIRINLPPQQNK